MEIGRRIYFDLKTGNIIFSLGENRGYINPTTVEEDIETFIVLSERNRETFDYIELEYGQYAQDFTESNGYRVNPETKKLEFSYPDPNVPEEPQEFIKPLSEKVEELEQRQEATDSAVLQLLMEGMI